MTIASYIFLIIGGLFYLLGGLGVLRMPDTLNRIQAGTKATTLGTFSVLLGVALQFPSWSFKLIVLLVFIAVSNPVGSSVIARATYKVNRPDNLIQDDMRGEENGIV